MAVSVGTPFDFLTQADNTDKDRVPTRLIVVLVLVLVAAGLGITFAEFNRPLATFRSEALRMAKGEIDVLSPSKFRGAYKKIAADLNDGIEKVATKGGAPRRAADLEQVLGPIPAQPQMSAFAVPGGPGGPPAETTSPRIPRPPVSDRGASAPRLRGSGSHAAVVPPAEDSGPKAAPRPPPAPKRAQESSPGGPPPPHHEEAAHAPEPPLETAEAAPPSTAAAEYNELEDWRRVFEEFLALKRQCGEETGTLTFEKFKGTLQRNKDALVARHDCSRVKFTVYVKEGKAALKASPVK
jgi:hypothetical protein